METLNLNTGDIMLVSAKGVAGGKVTLEFAQHVSTGNTNNSILSLINESDERFNKQKPRHAWMTGNKEDIAKVFNIASVLTMTEGQTIEIGQLNPTINGEKLSIRITETTKGSDYDRANLDKKAKRAGKDGAFIFHKGMHIFTNTDVVVGEPRHILLEMDARSETSVQQVAAAAIDQALGK